MRGLVKRHALAIWLTTSSGRGNSTRPMTPPRATFCPRNVHFLRSARATREGGASGMTVSSLTARFRDTIPRVAAIIAAIVFFQVCPPFATPSHAQISIWDQLQGSYGSSEKRRAPLSRHLLMIYDRMQRPGAATSCLQCRFSRDRALSERSSTAAVGLLCPPGRMMRAGDDDPRVPILRKRFQHYGRYAVRWFILRLPDVRLRARSWQ